MGITKEKVLKALDELEAGLNKASDDDLDQPEGGDLGNPVKEKLSEKAPKGKDAEVKKSDEEGGEEEAEEAVEPAESEEAEEAPVAKSFEQLPEEVQAKIDVSEFLKSLVDHTGEVIGGLRQVVAKSDLAHESRYLSLTDTINEVQETQGKIGIVLKAICEKIGVIENAPAHAPKAETVSKSEVTAQREFSSGLETEGTEPLFKGLSAQPLEAKSQITEKLCDLVRKGEAKDLDVIGFETSGHLSTEMVDKLKKSFN